MTKKILKYIQRNKPEVWAEGNKPLQKLSGLAEFHRKNKNHYLYVISWRNGMVGAWGTSSAGSKRLRKAMVFDTMLSGKYDRRVDYLMANIVWGKPKVWVFKMNKNAALKLERQIGSKVVHPNRREITHCFYRRTEKEIPANREEMSMWIYSKFCEKQFPNLSAKDQGHLTRYWTEVFCRPNDQWELTKKGKRKYFKHGDSLEPRYLVRKFRKDNLSENIIAELIPAIERVLNVKNLWGNEPPSIID